MLLRFNSSVINTRRVITISFILSHHCSHFDSVWSLFNLWNSWTGSHNPIKLCLVRHVLKGGFKYGSLEWKWFPPNIISHGPFQKPTPGNTWGKWNEISNQSWRCCFGRPEKQRIDVDIGSVPQFSSYVNLILTNCCEQMIDHRSYTHNWSSCEIKAWNRIRTHDLCGTGAVLYQLSYQANWELATFWVRNMPVEGKEYKGIYERSYIY